MLKSKKKRLRKYRKARGDHYFSEPAPIEEAKLLSDRQVAIRYDVDPRTIQRWSVIPDLGFPPAIYIRRRKYREVAKLDAWDQLNLRRAVDPQYRHPGIEKN